MYINIIKLALKMEKLSLKIQLSYFVYAIVFYTVAIVNHNFFRTPPSDLKSAIKQAFEAIIFWCTTNVLFLCTLVFTSLIGLVYCKLKKQEATKTFGFIFAASGLLLLSLIVFC